LEAKFPTGNPAYTDEMFEGLKSRLGYFTKELGRNGVTRKLLWEEYRQDLPQGYGLTQFCHHLSQHPVASKPSMPKLILSFKNLTTILDTENVP